MKIWACFFCKKEAKEPVVFEVTKEPELDLSSSSDYYGSDIELDNLDSSRCDADEIEGEAWFNRRIRNEN